MELEASYTDEEYGVYGSITIGGIPDEQRVRELTLQRFLELNLANLISIVLIVDDVLIVKLAHMNSEYRTIVANTINSIVEELNEPEGEYWWDNNQYN